MTTTFLDTSGLDCPLPVLRLKKVIRDVPSGATLEVRATDPGAVEDFQAFCRATGHQLVDWSERDGVFTFQIRKA